MSRFQSTGRTVRTSTRPHRDRAKSVTRDVRFEIEGLERRLLLSSALVRFAAEQTFATGNTPSDVVAADVNGDGKADLVVVNYYGISASVLLGNGNGTFQAQQTFATGREPFKAAVLDVNGDGKPDLIATNYLDNTVSVLLGNGNGTFQAQRTFGVGPAPATVVAADVNGDGKPDLIVTNNASGTVSILLGNGNGTFQAQSTLAVGSHPNPVAVADLNGDGKPDLIVGNDGVTTVSVLLGNGNGTFKAQQTVNVGLNPYAMTLADLNGDGKPDVVVGGTTVKMVGVLLGNGNGTFQSPQTLATGNGSFSIAVADLNGDGTPDLAVGNFTDKTISVLLGNGNGTFLTQQITAFASNPRHLTAADLDGDGIPDLVADQENLNSVGVLLNRIPPVVLSISRTSPAGTVDSGASVTFTVTFDRTVTGVVAGDFSVVTTGSVASTGIILTPVSGTVYTVAVNGISGAGTLGLNLVDNGTIRDLAGQQLAGGNPSFASQLTFAVASAPSDVVTGDINGDGKADVVVAQSNTAGSVSVLLGNGNGTLQAARTFAAGLHSDGVTIADVNGDGKPDLVVANFGNYIYAKTGTPGNVIVLLGNGNGTFQASRILAGGNYPTSVQVTDINGDGKPDLVFGSLVQNSYYNQNTMTTYWYQTGRVSVMLGNGNGTFQAQQIVADNLSRYDTSPAIADFNGDRKPDLATVSRLGTTEILLGNGNGTFQQPRTFGGAGAPFVPADVNSDGAADLVVPGGQGISVLLGQGNGNFQPAVFSSGPDFYGNGMTVADLNGDGKPDLVSATIYGNVGVMTGNGDGSFGSGQTFAFKANAVTAGDLNGDGRPDVVNAYQEGASGVVSVLLGGPGGSFTGQVYTVVRPPMVSSINRSAPSTAITSASSLSFALNFTSNVTNVLASDFHLATTGDVVATLPVVVSGSGSSYTVTVNGVHGSGAVQLELVDNDTIMDTLGTPLGGVGLFNGSFAGQSYTIVQPFPTVLSINRTTPPGPTTVDSSVSFTVTFSETVTGVAPADFSLATAGVTTTPPLVVTGSGAVYMVTVNGISGSGTLGLNLVDNGSIRDAAGNPLQGGTASFALQNQQTFAAGSASAFVTTSDLNGDGKPDLIIANNLAGNAGAVSVLLGNGNGTFGNRQTFAAGPNPYFVAVADVNGDGKPDLIVANETSSGTVSVLLGNGNGTFGPPQSFAIGMNPRSIAVADLNGDGRPDLIVGSSSFVSVLLGSGNGTFQAQTTLAAGTHPNSVALADVNGDGKPDILIANLGGNSASVLLGNGNGTFQAQQTFGVESSPRAIAAADVNGDGQFDLIVPSGSGTGVSVLLGNGNGTFQAQQTFATTGAAYGLAVADVNGDGKLDLVLGSNSTSAMTLLLGNGNGTFTLPQTLATGASPVSVALADFNGDGRLDLASANNGSSTVSVMLNNSNGNFTGPSYIIVPPADTINGTSGADSITLTRDSDGTDIDWGLFTSTGSSNGILPINDPRGLTINGNGGNDTIILSTANSLPNILHLNGSFTINGLSGSNPLAGINLEIGRSTVFISYSSSDPLSLIQGYLKNGYNNGSWNGTPTASTGVITSIPASQNALQTTAIGYADSADGLISGQPANTIELKYTLYGDTTLAGTVGSVNFTTLTLHYHQTTGGAWDIGDFNYDGSINFNDFTLLTRTYNTSLGSQAGPAIAAANVSTAPSPPADSGSDTSQSQKLLPVVRVTDSKPPPVHHAHPKASKRRR